MVLSGPAEYRRYVKNGRWLAGYGEVDVKACGGWGSTGSPEPGHPPTIRAGGVDEH